MNLFLATAVAISRANPKLAASLKPNFDCSLENCYVSTAAVDTARLARASQLVRELVSKKLQPFQDQTKLFLGIPPPIVTTQSGKVVVLDGTHRICAAKQEGLRAVTCWYLDIHPEITEFAFELFPVGDIHVTDVSKWTERFKWKKRGAFVDVAGPIDRLVANWKL